MPQNLSHLSELLEKIAILTKTHQQPVRLLAVTKTRSIAEILPLIEAGQLLLGENRPQELLAKQPALPQNIDWHLIGPLQSNKIRKIVQTGATIQSVDRLDLIPKLSLTAQELQRNQRIYLQINIGRDPKKSGFDPNDAQQALELALSLPNLQVNGLMLIPPLTPHPEGSRPFFSALHNLRDHLQNKLSTTLPELSMGMSHDFHIAIQEGSTIVRVGTALFGPKPIA